MKNNDFTKGPILSQLIMFMLPMLFALLLQATYGAVDLFVVGHFAKNADVSGVATGSEILMTITNPIMAFGTGLTVIIGHKIGEGKPEEAGHTIGNGLTIFAIAGVIFTLICVTGAELLAKVMNAPEGALETTTNYIRICGAGCLIITAYNLLGSIFRGLGDSRTPLIAVAIATVFNIACDMLFVAVLGMGASGAALATVTAQLLSVVISLIIISKRQLPFKFRKSYLKPVKENVGKIFKIGTPLAIQSLLVNISFLVLISICNDYGLTQSAGVGVAEKVCAFIMLVPSAFMQAMSAFVAQNTGAQKPERATKALKGGIAVSFVFGVVMFAVTFFRGDLLGRFFTSDTETIMYGADYLKAYAIDCLLTCFLFCFIGYFSGIQRTTFCMIQSVSGAFLVRIPMAFLFKAIGNGSLFLLGLATPCATVVQILMCFTALAFKPKKKEISQ